MTYILLAPTGKSKTWNVARRRPGGNSYGVVASTPYEDVAKQIAHALTASNSFNTSPEIPQE